MTDVECFECEGTGLVLVEDEDGLEIEETCDLCHGSGQVQEGDDD